MSSQDAGAAIAYLPNSSPDRGSSGVDGVRLRTGASDLSAGLLALTDSASSRFPMRCQVGLVLRQLPESDRAALVRLLDEPRPDGTKVPAPDIAGVLSDAGFNVGAPSIRRHRRRVLSNADRCTCE